MSLSADGKTLAIGAPRNGGTGAWAGHARVYQYNGTTKKWVQLGKDIDGETLFNQSGKSVSLSDDGLTVAIGAPLNGGAKGHVRVYDIPPVITSAATVSVAENTTNFFYTMTANEKITVTLGTAGGDEALFKLVDAKLAFKAAPDYEDSKNADPNIKNIYKLELKATDVGGNKSTLLLSVKVTDVTGVIISLPASLAFDDTKVGKTVVKDLTIANTGDATLVVTKVTYPAGFTGDWSNGTYRTIPVGGKKVVKVSFKPTEVNDYTGTLTVESNATKGKNTLDVSGKGTGSVISLPASLSFADTKVGETVVKDLTIKNTGNITLNVTAITLPAGFTGDWSSGTIAAGGKKEVNVSFKPTEVKAYTGTITVTSDAVNTASGGTSTLSVSGKGMLVTALESARAAESGKTVFPGLSVFPNPPRDVLHIKLPNQTLPVDIQLVDVNGQVVYERKAVTGDELSIDVSAYRSGVYVLVLESDGKIEKRKVVIR